jgi:hypothetical protein
MLLYHIIQKHFLYRNYKNWDSVVGRNSLCFGRREVGNPAALEIFSSPHPFRNVLGDPHSVVCNVYHVPFLGESSKEWRWKPTPYNAEFHHGYSYISTSVDPMLCYGMTFALIEITYCTTICYSCIKLFENHTLSVTSGDIILEYPFEWCWCFREFEFWFYKVEVTFSGTQC